MRWKEQLRSNLLFRNLLSDVIGYPVSAAKKTFIPYFQYKIGVYQRDYYLYFTSAPNSVRYTNDIFNKLCEYDGYDIALYLEFHYNAYADKADFLRFLKYETNQRLKLKLGKSVEIKLEAVLDWLNEKQEEQQTAEQQKLKTHLQQEIYATIEKEVNNGILMHQSDSGYIAKELVNTLATYLDTLVATTEEKMEAITDVYITGHIQLNNHNHLEKLIQLIYLIQNITAPKELVKGEQVFKQFSAIDIASILHLHFEAFKTKKINTIQGNIKVATDKLNFKNAKVQKLNEALEDFFYS